jgi:hypothetical protein
MMQTRMNKATTETGPTGLDALASVYEGASGTGISPYAPSDAVDILIQSSPLLATTTM